MMTRVWTLALLVCVALLGTVHAAPIGLSTPTSETTEAGVAADSFAIIRLLAIMELTDQQVLQTASRLEAFAEAKQTADQAESQALLQMREALKLKANALATGNPVPQAAQGRIDQGMLAVVRSRTTLRRAEVEAYSAFLDVLTPRQILMIGWDLSGPRGAQIEAVLMAYEAQANQALTVLTQLMWPPIRELMTIGANIYMDRRLAIIGDLLNIRDDPRAMRMMDMDQEQMVRNLIDVFDGWRMQMINDFGGAPPEDVLRDVSPLIATDALAAMGLEAPSMDLPPPLLSEAELQRLLLREDTANMLAQRADFIRQSGGAVGALGVPPGGW